MERGAQLLQLQPHPVLNSGFPSINENTRFSHHSEVIEALSSSSGAYSESSTTTWAVNLANLGRDCQIQEYCEALMVQVAIPSQPTSIFKSGEKAFAVPVPPSPGWPRAAGLVPCDALTCGGAAGREWQCQTWAQEGTGSCCTRTMVSCPPKSSGLSVPRGLDQISSSKAQSWTWITGQNIYLTENLSMTLQDLP